MWIRPKGVLQYRLKATMSSSRVQSLRGIELQSVAEEYHGEESDMGMTVQMAPPVSPVSREAAQEYSPRRKPWGISGK